MRPLVIIIGNPISQPLTCVRKGRKKGFLQELLPERFPKTLDLAQCHGMLRCASNVADPLALENLLEPRLAPPRSKLSTIVRQDLPRGAPLAYGTLDYFEHRLGCLLPEKPVPHDVAGMIVDDPHQVDRIHPLELEGEDVDLPQGIRKLPLEPPHPGRLPARLHRRIAKTRIVNHTAHRLGTDPKPLLPPQLVPDPSYPGLGILAGFLFDPSLELLADPPRGCARGLPDQRLHAPLPERSRPGRH
jgi:hypothetical protein